MAMDLVRVRAVSVFYRHAIEKHAKPRSLARLTPHGDRLLYLFDFCNRLVRMIDEEPERREKIMRWYGYLQGALWMAGVYTVDEIKNHSNPDAPVPTIEENI